MEKKKSESEISAENSLTNAFKEELKKPVLDLTFDIAEIGLDSIIESEVLSEVPLVKTVVSFYKIGLSLKERDFIRKLLIFFQEYNSGQLNAEKVQEFNEKLEKDESYQEKVTEHVLLHLDKLETLEKAKILARLLSAHTQGHYDWDHFKYLTASLNRLHPFGLVILKALFDEGNLGNPLRLDPEQFEILASAGLAFSQPQNVYTRTKSQEDGSTQLIRDLMGFRGPARQENTELSGMRNICYLSKLGRDLLVYGLSNRENS